MNKAQLLLTKINSLLTKRRVIGYSRVTLLAFALVLTIFSIFILDLSSYINNKDFLAFYTAGQIVRDGSISNLYDPMFQYTLQKNLSHDSLVLFLNPPLYAILMVPLTYFPYNVAYLFWNLVSITIALLSLKILNKLLDLRVAWWDLLTIFLASAVTFEAVMIGQNSIYFLGVYVACYALIKKEYDFLAGLVLSAGLLKPQLFLFLPLMFLYQKRWRTVGGFLTGIIVISGLTISFFGLDGVISFIELIGTSHIYTEGIQTQYHKMYTVASFIRMLSFDLFNPFIVSVVFGLAAFYLSFAKKEH